MHENYPTLPVEPKLTMPEDMRRATRVLFLDVDGTIRHGLDQLGHFVNHPGDVVMFPAALDNMATWKAAGGRIVAVSNQGGIALHKADPTLVGLAMQRTAQLAVDRRQLPDLPGAELESLLDVLVWCEHHPAAGRGGCWCRKPRTFLLHEGIRQLEQRYARIESYPPELALMVGDRSEDAQCAETAGIPFRWAEEWRAMHPDEWAHFINTRPPLAGQ